MARRSGFLAVAIVALAVTTTAATRAILSQTGGAQYDLGDVHEVHRKLMTDLKTAQEKAGIFVDDSDLFTRPLQNSGRKLQQLDLSTISSPAALSSLMSLVSQGFNVGAFPGQALSLPGGSPFGYAPTDDSYCLFATKPYTGASPPAVLQPGSPLSALPSGFNCLEASTSPPAGPDTFTVTFGGVAYVCTGTPGLAPAPVGRRLQQAPSPADTAIGNSLAAIGLPIWNCVVATTPDGNTTLGAAAEAVLNDLGVVAEHLLVYLNANGQLTYAQNIKNDFVSLTNPLYPTGPRLNFSIDFSAVDKDLPILKEIFGTPTPVTPSTSTVSSPSSGGQSSSSSGSSASGSSSGGSSSGGSSSGGSSSGGSSSGGSSSNSNAASAAVVVQTPSGAVTLPAAPPAALTVSLSVYDGYLDNCQTVIGSAPHADGNFDRSNNFTAVIVDGKTNMTVADTNTFAGQVTYIIPASKAADYSPLTLSTRKTADYCYDTATLLPSFNPLAAFITANASGMSASPASTVSAFGQAFGLTDSALLQALAINIPAGSSLATYDALGAAIAGSGTGLSVLKSNVQLSNLVTAGANLLSNDTTTYASYAIIMDQSIAKKILYSPPVVGRKLLQAPSAAPVAAVDLTNATTLASIITIAQQSVPTQPDQSTVAALNQQLTPAQTSAVAVALSNLNTVVASAPDATTTELGTYYAETTLANQIGQLVDGAITLDAFSAATTSNAISSAITKTALPGQLVPTPTASPVSNVNPVTQSSSTQSTSSGGLSHSGKVALATVLPIVGVLAIVAAVAFYISRKNRNGSLESRNNSAVWWRRPFARSSASGSPTAGPSTTV